MIKQAIGMLILGSAFASGVASAAFIDQQQPDASTVTTGVNNLSGKLQGFKPSVTNVVGGGFNFGRLYTDSAGAVVPVDMRIALWSGLPGSGGSEIAFGIANLSAIGWLDAFWTKKDVTAGQTYYLAITTSGVPLDSNARPANGGLEPQVNSDFGTLTPARYLDGAAYEWNLSTNATGAYAGFDFAFRTYSEEAPPPVPLPAAAWLLLSGLAGLGIVGRRKKA